MDAQSLRSIIKSARDLMRKDAGLNTDVDRIPQLAWILFLKCFDDFEKKRKALDKNYQEAIPKGYRWQDWASEKDEKGNPKKVLTGEDLIKFINTDLFPKLAGLVGSKGFEQRDVIASIFKELNNRLLSGHVLRQVVNLVNNVSFVSSSDIHTMAKLYEDMLVEMRDAAGSNGEFYTPRPVIRFIVEQIKPDLTKSEKILDPACGTGGFLAETLEYMKKDEKSKPTQKKLRYETLFGIEKKPMPYLLGMMNMLLHEVDKPNIARVNTLSKPLKEITEQDQFDVIMTNPPFGGEEETGISANLPVGMQTSDTALSFLLFIMYSLKENGRCAIILPNGVLFDDDKSAIKIKEKLLTDFNLHTIVKLPRGVFSPYTDIATNILFFANNGKTNEIWYYEHPLPENRKVYTKTRPLKYEELNPIAKWWQHRKTSKQSWKVNIKEILENNFDLNIQNPNNQTNVEHISPLTLLDEIIEKEKDILNTLDKLRRHIE